MNGRRNLMSPTLELNGWSAGYIKKGDILSKISPFFVDRKELFPRRPYSFIKMRCDVLSYSVSSLEK